MTKEAYNIILKTLRRKLPFQNPCIFQTEQNYRKYKSNIKGNVYDSIIFECFWLSANSTVSSISEKKDTQA
jgi:hypothetical protein